MPHLEQMWNSAVSVPKAYFDTSEGSPMVTLSEPVGHEVQTPPCLVQKEQVQARAGISEGSGSQARANEMFPQWQLPEISIGLYAAQSKNAWQVAPEKGIAYRGRTHDGVRLQSTYVHVSAPSSRRIRTAPGALGSKFLALTPM